MAATIPDLELSDAQAKKIVKLAIEHGAYSDDMPNDKAGRLEAANEAVSYCVDSWVNDGVRPDDNDEDIAAAGEAIMEIFDAAGIEVDEEGAIVTDEGEPESDDDDDDDDDDAAADDEEAFNPDDYIEGWTEFTAKEKVAALTELDLEDEDTQGVVEAVRDWENEQDKPSSRVLSWIDENLGEAEAEGDEEDGEGEAEAEAAEEPWEGYNGSTAADIKAVLKETLESDDGLEVDQVEYVKEYEEARERPRKRILDYCDELVEQLSAEPEPEEEEEAPKKKGALAKKSSGKTTDKKTTKAAKAEDNGALTVTLNGEDLGEFDAGAVLTVIAAITEEIEGGATSLALDLS
jgi:hypothetical protein